MKNNTIAVEQSIQKSFRIRHIIIYYKFYRIKFLTVILFFIIFVHKFT